MDDNGNSSSDFILGCACAAECCDGPIGGNTPAERRRWRFQMGVWFLAALVFQVALDRFFSWFFGV